MLFLLLFIFGMIVLFGIFIGLQTLLLNFFEKSLKVNKDPFFENDFKLKEH